MCRSSGHDTKRGEQINHGTEQFDDEDEGHGLQSFLRVVLLLVLVIVAVVAAISYFSTDDGMLPFDYEGF